MSTSLGVEDRAHETPARIREQPDRDSPEQYDSRLLLSDRFKCALFVSHRTLAGNGRPQREPTDDHVHGATRSKAESTDAHSR